jgi:hypothetical protein
MGAVMGSALRGWAETRDWRPTGRRDKDAVLFQHAKSLRRGRVAIAISGGFPLRLYSSIKWLRDLDFSSNTANFVMRFVEALDPGWVRRC